MPQPSVAPVAPAMAGPEAVEGRIAGMLRLGALVAVTFLVLGVLGMLAAGISPDAASFPVFDPSAVLPDLIALRPEGFLWTGILMVIATPILRVLGEAVGFGRTREPWLAAVALAILGVILASVLGALLVERAGA